MKIDQKALQQELQWLKEVFAYRLKVWAAEGGQKQGPLPSPPALSPKDDSPFAAMLRKWDLPPQERLILGLSLLPHMAPGWLEQVFQQVFGQVGDFPQLGCIKGTNYRGMIPTAQTALFLMAGHEPSAQWAFHEIFTDESLVFKKGLIALGETKPAEPLGAAPLVPDKELVERLMTGKVSKPRLSMEFPADLIQTDLEWEDLVVPSTTMDQLAELESWLQHQETVMEKWGMKKRLKPGYRALFHGPPGTGKTLAASLLGKYTQSDVFRVDLSLVVSKYIGETEKNLSQLFRKAENKAWILFFDEADALFGKRTNVKDAHDKYANQEVAYLLQKVENYNGLVILASNFRSNIDEAFSRRFQSIIYFPFPKPEERWKIWQKVFPEAVTLEKSIDLHELARRHELSGANILNVAQYACLKAATRQSNLIQHADVLEGVRKEYEKEGKVSINRS